MIKPSDLRAISKEKLTKDPSLINFASFIKKGEVDLLPISDYLCQMAIQVSNIGQKQFEIKENLDLKKSMGHMSKKQISFLRWFVVKYLQSGKLCLNNKYAARCMFVFDDLRAKSAELFTSENKVFISETLQYFMATFQDE